MKQATDPGQMARHILKGGELEFRDHGETDTLHNSDLMRMSVWGIISLAESGKVFYVESEK